MASRGVKAPKEPIPVTLSSAKAKGVVLDRSAFMSLSEYTESSRKGLKDFSAANMVTLTWTADLHADVAEKIRLLEEAAASGKAASRKASVSTKLPSLESVISITLKSNISVGIKYNAKVLWYTSDGETRHAEVQIPDRTQNFVSLLVQYFRAPATVLTVGDYTKNVYGVQIASILYSLLELKIAKANGILQVRVREDVPTDPGADYYVNPFRMVLAATNLVNSLKNA